MGSVKSRRFLAGFDGRPLRNVPGSRPSGDPAQGLCGKTAIYNDLKEFFLHIPDNYTVAENLFEDGNWVILEWTGGGTFYASARSKGKKIKAQGCGFFRFRNGKIVFQRGYWDKAAWDAQIEG